MHNENEPQKEETTCEKPRRFFSPFLFLPIFTLLLAGCRAVGPDYEPPAIEMAEQWANQTQALARQTEELARWWDTLDDPGLTALIEDALQNNLDLKKARSSVRQARLERIVTKSSLYPKVDADAGARKSYTKADDSGGNETDSFSAGFDASWEIDLFGGTRRSIEASQADYEASLEALRDVQVSLTAEVALTYIEIRTYQERLQVAQKNIAIQEETLDLLKALDEAGNGDALAIVQSSYNLESTKSSLPDIRTGLAESINSLAILTGKAAGTLQAQVEVQKPLPRVSMELAVGVPADLLRRRPDIREAERKLAAQTARIGEAQAELYPSLSLSGSIGIEAISADRLINAPTRSWSIGPSISWPIFRAGSLRNQVKIENEKMEQAFISYQAAILDATKEVENALVAYVNEQQKRMHLEEGVKAARLAKELSEHLYATGMTDFSDVLDAQRSLLNFEDDLSQSDGTVLSNLIQLYKALGGGWSPMGANPQSPSKTR